MIKLNVVGLSLLMTIAIISLAGCGRWFNVPDITNAKEEKFWAIDGPTIDRIAFAEVMANAINAVQEDRDSEAVNLMQEKIDSVIIDLDGAIKLVEPEIEIRAIVLLKKIYDMRSKNPANYYGNTEEGIAYKSNVNNILEKYKNK